MTRIILVAPRKDRHSWHEIYGPSVLPPRSFCSNPLSEEHDESNIALRFAS